MKNVAHTPLLLALILSAPVAAQAQAVVDEGVGKKLMAEDDGKKKDGWSVKAKIGASASLNHNSNVVGAQEGLTLQLGGLLAGEAIYTSGQHGWENILDIQHAQSKTPNIDGFVKSLDMLDFTSTYLYRLESPDWLGFYGRLRANTQLLPTKGVFADDVTISRTDIDGNVTTQAVQAQDRVDLTGSFEPLLLRETVGAFANPISKKVFTFKSKLGIGGQHILTRRGFALQDDGDTPAIELVQLRNIHEFGAELGLNINGGLWEDKLTWFASAGFFLPFVTNVDTDLNIGERTTVDLGAGLSLKLAEWLSLDYGLNVRRVPLVVEQWQVTNSLLLTAGFTLI